jgi:hypothetical protein
MLAATNLKEGLHMPTDLSSPVPSRARHDWPTILDGTPRLYKQGEDYQGAHRGFRTMVYSRATEAGKKVSVRCAKEGKTQIGWNIQAH